MDSKTATTKHEPRIIIVGGGLWQSCRMLERFGCDLIVTRVARARSAERLLRGSLTDEVVRNANCPVLVVKAPAARPRAPAKPATAQPSRVA